MPKLVEMGQAATLGDQLKTEEGPVVLINTFVVPCEDADALIAAWGNDAGYMKAQPGFISTQLHRGIAGSGVFLNYAIWQSVAHFRAAFGNPEFQAKLTNYPANATVSPHLFKKIEVPGICTA